MHMHMCIYTYLNGVEVNIISRGSTDIQGRAELVRGLHVYKYVYNNEYTYMMMVICLKYQP
jgi:hypothetical protein